MKRRAATVLWFAWPGLLGLACTPPEPTPPAPGSSFREVARPLGEDGGEAARVASGGFALADFDGDGAHDVFVTTGYSLANLLGPASVGPASQLLLAGHGDGTFRMGESEAGFVGAAVAPVAADLDGDGDVDLFVPSADADDGENLPSEDLLFENVDGALVPRGPIGPAVAGTAYAVCAADFDGDADLDIFVANHVDTDGLGFDAQGYAVGQRDRLYRNDGGLTFTDVTLESGSVGEPRLWSNACLVHDVDDDGDLDLWVAYEQSPRGVAVHLNEGGLVFRDASEELLGDAAGLVGNWMGLALGDYNADGSPDVFVTNMGIGAHSLGGTSVTDDPSGTALHMMLERQADGTFRDVAPDIEIESDFELPGGFGGYPDDARGLAGFDFGWTAWFADYDNDGDEDLFFAGAWAVSESAQIIGTARTGANPGRLFENDGTGRFREVAARAGISNTAPDGFIENGWGSALADLNGDGWLDLALANQWFDVDDHPGGLRVWLNEGSAAGRSLRVSLRGGASGPHAFGARLTLETQGGVQVRVRAVSSSISAPSLEPVHFGLAEGDAPVRLTVAWPAGDETVIEPVEPGALEVEEP